jgi:hypothetical protein
MNTITELPFCLIGLTEEEALKRVTDESLIFKVFERDGKKVKRIFDWRTDRINVAIENGIVVRAHIG